MAIEESQDTNTVATMDMKARVWNTIAQPTDFTISLVTIPPTTLAIAKAEYTTP